MLALTLFAILAGAGTALSPCVVPVLPALLSAGGSGGRRRPLGVVLGLTATFAVTIIGLAKVTGGVGLGSDPLRLLAVVVLVGFGVAIAVPAVARRLEKPLAGLSRFGPRSRGDGFSSGLLVGGALGFVYTPCAGPILAAVISVSAASGSSVVIGLAYAAGSGVMLLALALGGRRMMERVRAAGRGAALQRALGVIMVLTAVVIATQLDVRLDQQIAQHIPDVSLTAALEKSHAVSGRLSVLHGRSRYTVAPASATASASAASGLPDLGPAPEFTGTQRWFNTPGSRPLTLASLRGHVVLVDFWTYTCINCLRTLPYLEAWDAKYRRAGLTIVGVHTPEFSFEHDAGNVSRAISQLGIRYPVAQDNNMGTWNAWGNQYWPAEYLIDSGGHVRDASFGEGEYAKTESAIRGLLAQTGQSAAIGADAKPIGAITPSQQTTPETYLGSARAQGWADGRLSDGTRRYVTHPVRLNEFSYGGNWTVGPEQGTAGAGATLDAEVLAKNIYMVLSPPAGGGTGRVQVLIDGRRDRAITVSQQKLYTLASFASDQRHHLTLHLSPGVRGFSFTFG
ncbi:MAG: cytochrome c biogenesis protein DipZ [Solirubrobacteraceae bacterium]